MEPGRAFRPPATSVTRPGDLRRRVDRAARALARHERGEDRPERPDAARAARGGGGRRRPAAPPAADNPFGDAAVATGRGRSRPRRIPLPRRQRRPRRPSEFSDAVAIQIPSRRRPARASRTSSSATARTRSISGSSIWPAPTPLQFTGKGSADITPDDAGGLTGVASYDQGEWSVIFKRPRRPAAGAAVHARRVPADRLLGLGRRSRASAATGAASRCGTRSTSSPRTSPRPSARWSGRRCSFSGSSWP